MTYSMNEEQAYALRALEQAMADESEARRRQRHAVMAARAAGLSYSAIGRHLGISRQAVWQRWNELA